MATLTNNNKLGTKPEELKVEDLPETVEDKEETKEPKATHWQNKNQMTVSRFPLHPQMLTGEHHHESANGNITILDRNYALLRIGRMFADLGLDLSLNSAEIGDFCLEALKYATIDYPAEREAIDSEQAISKFEKTAKAIIPQMRKLALATGQRDKYQWTEEQWLNHLRTNGL